MIAVTSTTPATAYHEAAHVVAAFHLYQPVEYATIAQSGNASGSTSVWGDLDDLAHLHCCAIIALAGRVAEGIILDDDALVSAHAIEDEGDAWAIIAKRHMLTHGTMPPRQAVDYYRRSATAIILQRWIAVCDIALALMEQTTIDGSVLHAIYMQALTE